MAAERAFRHLLNEADLVNMIRSWRFTDAALKHLLEADVHRKLKAQSEYFSVELPEVARNGLEEQRPFTRG